MLTYREYALRGTLRPIVECVWIVRDPRASRARGIDRVIPDACPEIIVHLADPFRRLSGRHWRRQPEAFLAGTLSRPWMLRAGPRVDTLGIRFRPAAITRLFDLSMAAAADRERPLAEVVGVGRAGALLESLRLASSGAARVRAARRWLAACQCEASPPRDVLAARAVRAVLAARGGVRVADLAADLGVPRRRLERAFERDLGIRPKLFARIVRLQAALATLDAAERGRAVEWALASGYFDQAHLARDFRAIAGRRPLRPREGDGELARHFSDPARLLALLAHE